MRFLEDLSIKRKLAAMSFLTTGTTLLLVGVVFAVYEVRAYRRALVDRLATQAEIVGLNSSSALVFEDERAAAENLASLRADPQIEFAGIYTTEGRPFATYERAGASTAGAPTDVRANSPGPHFQGNSLELTRRIESGGRPLGTVYLRADLKELQQRVAQYIEITGAVLVVSLLAAVGIAGVLQRLISGPILELVKTARVVAFEKNYGVRAATRSRDELGTLVASFNEMLDQIQRRNSELQTLNRELEHRTGELARKNEEVEAFVYIVSHDLRAPLVNLQGFSRELQRSCDTLTTRLKGVALEPEAEREVREVLDAEIPGALRFIVASTTKFERLINALLQLSRLGRQEYHHETLDMAALLAATLDSLHSSIQKAAAEVVVDSLPRARGDSTAVGQVFSNLVVNALRYLQAGRPSRIEIGGEEDGPMNHYWVRDNGVGLSESAQKKLFQVFQRFHPHLAPGEGMGLAIVKRVVERHGGRVWAESKEGVGTTFHFTLPVAGEEGTP